MPANVKERQISVRVSSETDAWREPAEKLLDMFNEAAAHLGKDDFEEREFLLGGFAAGQTD